jgi:CHAT domain-containing protein
VYAAFVRAPGSSDPALIRLGPASEIEELAARWRDALSRKDEAVPVEVSERDARLAGERLRRRLWDPILRALGSPQLTLVVPAGELHLVPLEALPDGEGYLVEKGSPVHYLSSERDVVMASPAEASRTRGSGLLAFGAPDFGEGKARAASANDLRSIRFEPLPLSSDEAREAAETWRAVRDGGEAILLTGGAATESAFKSLAPGKRAVHLATHGFFLGSGAAAPRDGTRGVGGIVPARQGAAGAIDPSPLLLSGVAFAGANRRGEAAADARDDGILTAEEIAGLDLSSLEWAVLSACDTGTGKLDVSEGVLGLRRAFQAAGARTLITSLWSAEDRAAREWMRELYRARFLEGLGTAEAARKASRTVLALRRSGGRSTHPFYWAGFVAAGDWR